MSLAEIVPFVIKVSIFLTTFSLGLRAHPADTLLLFRRPGLFVRALLAMAVVMPLVAVGLATTFGLYPAIKVALVALALSPVPPLLPRKVSKTEGSAPFIVGLLVTAALISIAFIPAALQLLRLVFSLPGELPLALVARIALMTVLVPVLLGILARRIAPGLAERMAGPLSTAAVILLALAVVPVLIGSWRGIVALVGNGSILAFAAFVAIGLAAGRALGGPDPDERRSLALATACRHPGIAAAVAHATFPGQPLVLPAVGLYLLVSMLVTIPYVRRSERDHGR